MAVNKPPITNDELVALIRHAKVGVWNGDGHTAQLRSGVVVTIRAVTTSQMNRYGVRISHTMIEGENREWSLVLHGWHYQRGDMEPDLRGVRFRNLRNHDGNVVVTDLRGDEVRFRHDMALCRMFDDLTTASQ